MGDYYGRIAAVDFDDTLRRRGGKSEGERVSGSKRGMWWLYDHDYAIIIWTCSDWSDTQILDWLMHKGYPPVAAINRGLTPWDEYSSSPKVVAHVYIDDRAAMWQGWNACIAWLERQHPAVSKKVKDWERDNA